MYRGVDRDNATNQTQHPLGLDRGVIRNIRATESPVGRKFDQVGDENPEQGGLGANQWNMDHLM